ncbi:Sugar kinase of the NBD/HSP70 family, may contain an N-terminal HTH domain [Arthrobacter alpinus]|uniref:Sugar kinase of the NBD/HSP70 family, may contain an N-terminal HTH domain n=2 Tax=Arthrobacter alpinus TaxID=656366 RepID=A0A1H5G4A2_9MICC|nr:Sugar kinase of the NBD/HSP70 family, may contain an N-terminal HTH domain [Arthrobacter alpinus]
MGVPEVGLPQRRRGTNLPKMGDYNQAVILDSIRRAEEGLSRVELAASAGLAAQTVSNICRRLLDSGLIVEAGKEASGPGKPRTILRLNPRGMYAVGIHIDPALTSYALLDAVGTVLVSVDEATDLAGDPAEVVAAMGATVRKIIVESGVDEQRIAGVGVATPGPVDAASGTVVDPPHMPGWTRVPLRDILHEATGLPVVVDKDVTASAVAEVWAGSANSARNFVFVYIGTGIGAGLVLNDEVVRGSSGNVGEIGHIIADPDGPDCDCGRRGCIKVTCMPETLVAQARAAGILPAVGPPEDSSLPNDMAALAQAAAEGNASAVEILAQSAIRLAGAASVLTNLLDVERVVFGGPFWPALAATHLKAIPPLLEHLSVTTSVHSVDVMGTIVSSGEEAFGAACLVMEKTFSPSATRLLLDSKN